ncbi:hypothetical protein ACH5RR_021724 [Cinchona calisaya]|uniref:Uncharacterized protein n=1 Tax=Cinchona calisaya TaxID=153742 RepID=A0ABD2ZLN6_9GENT
MVNLVVGDQPSLFVDGASQISLSKVMLLRGPCFAGRASSPNQKAKRLEIIEENDALGVAIDALGVAI